MQALTLASRLEQIENMVHSTQEVNSPRVAAVRPRVLRAQVRQIEGQHRRVSTALAFEVPAVDSRLPGGALPLGARHEIAGGGNGAIDGAAAALLPQGSPPARAARCSGVSRGWTCSRQRSRKPG